MNQLLMMFREQILDEHISFELEEAQATTISSLFHSSCATILDFSAFLIFFDDFSILISYSVVEAHCWPLVQRLEVFVEVVHHLRHLLLRHAVRYRHRLEGLVHVVCHHVVVVVAGGTTCDQAVVGVSEAMRIVVAQIALIYQLVFGLELWIVITTDFKFKSFLLQWRRPGFWLLWCWINVFLMSSIIAHIY